MWLKYFWVLFAHFAQLKIQIYFYCHIPATFSNIYKTPTQHRQTFTLPQYVYFEQQYVR